MTKGAEVAMVLIAVFVTCSVAAGNPPLREPLQNADFCNQLTVAGTGTIDIANSIVDKKQAIDYYNVMQGDGDIEMDSTVSQAARNIQAPINGSIMPVNLYDIINLTYSGMTPLVGEKAIKSDDFRGGIGAEVKESFSVTEIEKIQTTYSPMHAVGMDTKTSFNGTWITDALQHLVFNKDVKVHEAFTGKFDVEKIIQFREKPVPEQKDNGCDGLDC